MQRWPIALLLGALTAFGAVGCYAHAEPAYVEARVAPVYVDTYPRTYYEGRTVYLIDGHWYFQDRGRWVYYRREPEPLYRERVYIERAPRAPHRYHYERSYERGAVRPREPYYSAPPARHSAPPARHSAPRQSAPPGRHGAPSGRQSAPPAHRTR